MLVILLASALVKRRGLDENDVLLDGQCGLEIVASVIWIAPFVLRNNI
jgi:hypothetical protein